MILVKKQNLVNATKLKNTKLKVKTNGDNECRMNSEDQYSECSLKKLSIRGNQLYGSILIGNYNYLTQLEVCNNEIEILDLSSLGQLESLKCNYNRLRKLKLNGTNMTTLTARSNCLHSITAIPSPCKLTYLDISHNKFIDLPKWIANSCQQLLTLLANNNMIQNVTDLFSSNNMQQLKVLNLSCNRIYGLQALSNNFCGIEQLYLHSNNIEKLPHNFFTVTYKELKILNLSCNKLHILPPYELSTDWLLEELYLSSNYLTGEIFGILQYATKLKVLHVCYNRISELLEFCLDNWKSLEVLVLSGNMLQHLPNKIAALKQLQVLRVHSNLLFSLPKLYALKKLKILDLAHNHFDHVDLHHIMPKQLKYLDLSCNVQMHVDAKQVTVCQSQRNWSLVDVTGKNRNFLSTQKINNISENSVHSPWLVGFSETPGYARKLLVRQLRMCNYRCHEGLFGMFESEVSSNIAKAFATIVPQILQQQQVTKGTLNEYMKYILLTEKKKINVSTGVSVILCHLSREYYPDTEGNMHSKSTVKRYVLRVASCGNVGAYIVRKTSTFALTEINNNFEIASVLQESNIIEMVLEKDDEYIVIANEHLWQIMDINRVARELRKEENVVLAAKRIQDIAQSFGAMDNLSVIVVRLRNMNTDVAHLIKEYNQSVREKTEAPLGFQHKCFKRSNGCSDRHSPNGMSFQQLSSFNEDDISVGIPANDKKQLNGANARVMEEVNEMEILAETASVLSEEQFKCWEYMLEQNTQLLFDKELNTISKSLTKNHNSVPKLIGTSQEKKSNLINVARNRFMSHSSPQLLETANKHVFGNCQQHLSFLRKRFGNNRPFQVESKQIIFNHQNRESFSTSGRSKSNFEGGQNAAYFGSLQRLMPYNFEYDFSTTRERSTFDQNVQSTAFEDNVNDNDDAIDNDPLHDHKNRINKYWSIDTTEL